MQKMVTALVLGFGLTLSSAGAFAGGVDPRFSYEAAENAYSYASVPTLRQLQANAWRTTGVVSHSDHSQDGYWPNGEMVLDGQTGHFHSDSFVTSERDAFGNLMLTWNESLIGAESGAVYWNQVLAAKLLSEAVVIYSPASAQSCQTQNECRVVANSSSLLCRMIVTDKRKVCDAYPRDTVNRYRMMMPIAR